MTNIQTTEENGQLSALTSSKATFWGLEAEDANGQQFFQEHYQKGI